MGRMQGLLAAGCLLLASGAAAQLQVQPTALESQRYAEVAAELERDQVLQEFADAVNQAIRLPQPVGLRFAECGQINAFYNPADKRISMCLELVEYYVDIMSGEYPDEAQAMNAAEGAFTLVFFHELGHALVDVL